MINSVSARTAHRRIAVALGLLAAFTLAACSSKSKDSGPASTPPASSSSSAASSAAPSSTAGTGAGSGDAATIKTNFTRFFDSKTPQAEAVTLVQDGPAFAAAIAEQAASPLTKGSSVEVTKVTVLSPNKATVTFSVLIDGKPVLQNQGGWAIKEDGTWKVAGTTFCGLVSLSGTTPAACAIPKATSLPS